MSRRLFIAFTITALLVVPACSLGGTSVGVSGDITTPTPTPTPALVLGGGHEPPTGVYNIELELTYMLVPTVGTDQPLYFPTTVPISPALSAASPNGSGEGEILDDVTFTIGPVTTHNVADWIIAVDATLDPAMGDEPLSLHFTFDGRGYAGAQGVELGAHMDTGGSTYEYTLSLPLEEGATKSFDVEGWKDYKEWMVVLHLK